MSRRSTRFRTSPCGGRRRWPNCQILLVNCAWFAIHFASRKPAAFFSPRHLTCDVSGTSLSRWTSQIYSHCEDKDYLKGSVCLGERPKFTVIVRTKSPQGISLSRWTPQIYSHSEDKITSRDQFVPVNAPISCPDRHVLGRLCVGGHADGQIVKSCW